MQKNKNELNELAKLFLLDATVFGLFKAILKTSGRYAANGKKKGGIKKNTVIEATSLMPFFLQFDAAADSDHRIYKKLSLPARRLLYLFWQGIQQLQAACSF